MTTAENALAQIQQLLTEQALPKSACSGALIRKLRPLLDAGIVVEERSGAGRRLVVVDGEAARNFLQTQFPTENLAGLAGRLAGVAGFRDSKVFQSDTQEIVSVRAWSDSALLRDGKPVGAALATETHGLFSFLLHKRYVVNGAVALVENPFVFLQFQRLGLSVELAIYGHGRVSTRLLDWLTSSDAPEFSLLHLPDYDPVGLSEFERLRGRLGQRVKLHLPEQLDGLFERFGKAALLENPTARALLAVLRKSNSPEVRRVVGFIDHYNSGLEQEALLLPKREYGVRSAAR